MRLAIVSWERVNLLNRFLVGTWIQRIKLELLPGRACAARRPTSTRGPVTGLVDYVAAGRATQCLWLTEIQLGLRLQPKVTPLKFAGNARDEWTFSAVPDTCDRDRAVRADLVAILCPDVAARTMLMASPSVPLETEARSVRLDFAELSQERGT